MLQKIHQNVQAFLLVIQWCSELLPFVQEISSVLLNLTHLCLNLVTVYKKRMKSNGQGYYSL